MRTRGLAIFPLVYAAVFIVIASRLEGDSLGSFVVGQKILVRILGALGCYAALRAFERGDHLRRAWLFLLGGTLVILLRDVLRLFPPFDPASASAGAQVVLSGLGVLSNVGLLSGVWMLARAWKKAAIALPGGRAGVAAMVVMTAALAVVVAGPAAVKNAQAVYNGDWSALVLFVSAIVDITLLCLVAPLLLTAVSLRGGSFVWPWALITASQLSWLLYDGAAHFGPALGMTGFPLPDVFRGLAENFLFAAGLAQLFVVRQVRRAAA
jgi:hypothetical protein